MTYWITTLFELNALRSFLNHLSVDVAGELERIEKFAEEGKYRTYGELESAQDYPWARFEIGLRAMMHELNSLIESRIYSIASAPWSQSKKHKGPKSIDDLKHITPNTLSQVKMVTDLKFQEAVNLIENYHRIKLDNIDTWKQICNIRSIVNAYKHRKGRKHFREVNWEKGISEFFDKHQINQNIATKAISTTEIFLRALDSEIRQSKNK